MAKNDKYVVIKREAWDSFKTYYTRNKNFLDCIDELEKADLDGAEVIRHQDITAAPIFWHYAQSMSGFVDVQDILGRPLDDDTKRRLLKIAEHFTEAAHEAEECDHAKLPD